MRFSNSPDWLTRTSPIETCQVRTPSARTFRVPTVTAQADMKSQRGPMNHPAKDRSAELYAYREHTVGMLRRYFRLSIEFGRLPSMLGREFFRARVSSYRMSTFEDGIIFVHDVERCLDRLEVIDRQLIARIVFQEYTTEETAALFGCTRRTIARRYASAIDEVSELFLVNGLLREFARSEETSQRPEMKKREKDLLACAEEVGFPKEKAVAGRYWNRVKPLKSQFQVQAVLMKANISTVAVSQLPPAV